MGFREKLRHFCPEPPNQFPKLKRYPVAIALTVILIAIPFSLFSFNYLVQPALHPVPVNVPVPTPATGSNTSPLDASQTAVAQEKAMGIMKNVLSADLSKYTIELKINSIMDGSPLANDNRKITNLMYALTPIESKDENSIIEVYFAVEKDVVTNYFITPVTSQVIATTQYANQQEAAKGFLEKDQTYTTIDSGNLIAMLDNTDLSKNSTTTQGNTKFVVSNSLFGTTEQTTLRWTHTVNGADYTTLEIGVNTKGSVISVYDTRALYTIGDTSINISKEQAIDIALENLKDYSYDMFDGAVVSDFKMPRDNIVASLVTGPVDYELRPYWDLRMMLDEVYPGNVQGITAFIGANTGEVISYSNIALGSDLAGAQTNSTITIKPDGSVEGTDQIQREGNVYTFTGDISGILKIEKDGITIDGAGYAIGGNDAGIDLRKDSTAIPHAYGDAIVKNVRFSDKSHIFASSNGNTFLNNTFEGGGIEIKGNDGNGKGNTIKNNIFIDGTPSISADYSGENVVTENDFINCRIFLALYGKLDFDRNYWSDYETLYPDAKEIGQTGIWDTPYNYNKTDWSDFPFVDSNPLVHPTNGAGAPQITDEPTSVPTTSADGDEPGSFPTALIIAVGIVSVVIVSISLLVYIKKRK
jgi:hypothetical protein